MKVAQTLATATQPFWLRVKRTGNTWLFTYSRDGVTWMTAGSFSYAMTVARIGPYAGNAGSPPPAWTATVDYFFNTAQPDRPRRRWSGVTSAASNDDFSGASLNTATWSFVNPGGACGAVDGRSARGHRRPGGSSHDPNSSGDGAPRLMQPIAERRFQRRRQVRFAVSLSSSRSRASSSSRTRPTTCTSSILQNWFQTAFVVTTVSGSTVTTNANFEIYNKPSIVLRVARTGDVWSFGYSYDGLHWTAAATSSRSCAHGSRAGVFGGNFGGSSSPAFIDEGRLLRELDWRRPPPRTVSPGRPRPAVR